MNSLLRNNMMLLVAAAALVGCGGKGKSDNAHISIIPSQPIVFTAPISYPKNGSTVTVTPPWFRFSVNLNNQTGEPLTVVAVSTTITGIDASGTFQTATATFDPSQFDYTNESVTCSYFTFGTYQAEDSMPLGLRDAGPNCIAAGAIFYADSLPNPGTGFFSYTVKLQIDGWFGTESRPTDRFQRVVYFSTQ